MNEVLTVIQMTDARGRSGGARQAALLTRGLVAEGHRVVFCAREDSASLAWAREVGAETRSFDFGGLRDLWRAGRRLRALAREVGADLIHTHHTKAHNVGVLATFGGGLPPVVANRGVLFRPHFPAKFRSPRTAAVITNSERVKQVLVDCRVGPRKIHVVYNAVEPPAPEAISGRLPELRRELVPDGFGPVVGTVGSGRPEKGFQHLVEAAPRILRDFPKAAFVLVGASTDRLRPRLQELGVEEHFRLAGYRRDAVAVMGLFDVFALPSVDMESCPNVLLEAMGVGLPVVGTDVGGIGEILERGQNGTLVPPGDAETLARAVVEQLRDPDGARAAGARGRERLASDFSLEAKVRGTLDVYRAVLAGAT